MSVPLLEALYIAILTWVVVQYIGKPLLQRTGREQTPEEAHQKLLDEKESILTSIKELDFDREMGKIDSDEYARLRSDLESQAIAVMKALDAGDSDDPAGTDAVSSDEPERDPGHEVVSS